MWYAHPGYPTIYIRYARVKTIQSMIKRLLEDIRLNRNTGMWSWVLQRLTGVLLTLYLFPHLFVIHSSTKGPEVFDGLTSKIQAPIWHLLDIALIAIIIFHLMNGVRIIVVEIGSFARAHKPLLLVMMALGAILFFFCVLGILPKFSGH